MFATFKQIFRSSNKDLRARILFMVVFIDSAKEYSVISISRFFAGNEHSSSRVFTFSEKLSLPIVLAETLMESV